jgi:hypothetical protein
MATKWVNFRLTSGGPAGFAGDGADSVYNLGSDTFPSTGHEIGGVYPQGWVADASGGADQYTDYAGYEHQAGRIGCTSGTDNRTFRIGGLTAGHTYRLHVSLGAIASGIANGFVVYSDNRTTSRYAQAGGSVPTGNFMDAAGNVWSNAANWVSNEVPVDVLATTTDFYFAKNTNSAYFNTIGIEDLGGPAGTSRRTLLGVG